MKDRMTVVVYGNSLLSASIATSLGNQPGFVVVPVDDQHADAVAQLTVIRPAVVLVDVTDTLLNAVLTYLVHQPTTTLIGIDPDTCKGLVLHGQCTPLTSMRHLVTVIEQQIARLGTCPAMCITTELIGQGVDGKRDRTY